MVPTLRVVTRRQTLCVNADAERPERHSHAERWNDPDQAACRQLILRSGQKWRRVPLSCGSELAHED